MGFDSHLRFPIVTFGKPTGNALTHLSVMRQIPPRVERRGNNAACLRVAMEAAGLAGDREGALLRTSYRRTGSRTDRAMTQSVA